MPAAMPGRKTKSSEPDIISDGTRIVWSTARPDAQLRHQLIPGARGSRSVASSTECRLGPAARTSSARWFARRIHNEALLGRQCGLYQIRVQQKFGEKFLCRTVTVFRDPERSGSVSVEITGRLNAVLGGVRLAHWVRGVWDRVVARGRYLQSPRQILPEFSITAA